MICQKKDAGLKEGERRKAEAFATLESWREVLIRRARRVLLQVLLERGTATADDVREMIAAPEGINPKFFGVVPGLLARKGIIRANGYVKSWRPARHASPNTLWELVDRAAALAWLAAHPDLPDPVPAETTDQVADAPAVAQAPGPAAASESPRQLFVY